MQSGLRRFGFEVRRAGAPAGAAWPDPWIWIRETQGIRTIIDIGAHAGEFSTFLAGFLDVSATYAFEPLPACQERLRACAARIPDFHVFPVALADRSGVEVFYENTYGPSSSLLHVGLIHKREFPHTDGETPTAVQVQRLDDVLDADRLARNIFIKIDVQGVEERVIRGGRRVFGAAQIVMVEMAFLELYDGQPLFEGVHEALREAGLRFAGVKDQVVVRPTGQPLFAHCLYIRERL